MKSDKRIGQYAISATDSGFLVWMPERSKPGDPFILLGPVAYDEAVRFAEAQHAEDALQ